MDDKLNIKENFQYLCYFLKDQTNIAQCIVLMIQNNQYGLILNGLLNKNYNLFKDLSPMALMVLKSLDINLFTKEFWLFLQMIFRNEEKLNNYQRTMALNLSFSLFLLLILIIFQLIFFKGKGIVLGGLFNLLIFLGFLYGYHKKKQITHEKFYLLLLFLNIINHQNKEIFHFLNQYPKIIQQLNQGIHILNIIPQYYKTSCLNFSNQSTREDLQQWIYYEIQWHLKGYYQWLNNYWIMVSQVSIILILTTAIFLVIFNSQLLIHWTSLNNL